MKVCERGAFFNERYMKGVRAFSVKMVYKMFTGWTWG